MEKREKQKGGIFKLTLSGILFIIRFIVMNYVNYAKRMRIKCIFDLCTSIFIIMFLIAIWFAYILFSKERKI